MSATKAVSPESSREGHVLEEGPPGPGDGGGERSSPILRGLCFFLAVAC